MDIANIDKIKDCPVIVLLGRNAAVREVVKQLYGALYYAPRIDDYFEDYPDVVNILRDSIGTGDGVVCITTQSLEFVDSLLSSDLDFKLVTVRDSNINEERVLRLRVHTKEEAISLRNDCDMDLRK